MEIELFLRRSLPNYNNKTSIKIQNRQKSILPHLHFYEKKSRHNSKKIEMPNFFENIKTISSQTTFLPRLQKVPRHG